MAANMMDMVRELKSLNARKKAGESLSALELQRRKELKSYLKTALAEQNAANNSANTAPAQTAQTPAPQTPAPQTPAPQTPAPARAPTPPAMPAVPTPAMASVPSPVAAAPPPMTPRTMASSIQPQVAAPVIADKYKDRFAIADAGDLLKSASSSDAVNALDNRQAHASQSDLDEAEAKADRAAKANKTREKATTDEEIANQFQEIGAENQYTTRDLDYQVDDYFSGHYDEGFEFVEQVVEARLDLLPLDPRELEMHKAGIVTDPSAPGAMNITLPPGLAFLDDFPALYRNGILTSPDDEAEPDSDDPNLLIPGKRKVTVHLLAGGVKRGVVREMRKDALGFKLEPIGTGRVEEFSIQQIKAMFIHKQPKATPPVASGRTLTVTFRDRKSIKGSSDDYQPGVPMFTLVPPPGRGQFERILVNSTAVAQVG